MQPPWLHARPLPSLSSHPALGEVNYYAREYTTSVYHIKSLYSTISRTPLRVPVGEKCDTLTPGASAPPPPPPPPRGVHAAMARRERGLGYDRSAAGWHMLNLPKSQHYFVLFISIFISISQL